MALALWNHFGKKKKTECSSLLLLIFSLFVFSFHALNYYPAWKNLPDCIKPDAFGIVHFLMKSRANSTAGRYIKEIQKFITWCKSRNISVKLPLLFRSFQFTWLDFIRTLNRMPLWSLFMLL